MYGSIVVIPESLLTYLRRPSPFAHRRCASPLTYHQHCPLLEQQVVVHSLVNRADMNGASGRATDFDFKSGRYVIRLDGEGGQLAKLKPANVRAK